MTTLKNIVTWAKISLALAAPAAAQDAWVNVQPGYHTDGYTTTRLEGGVDLGKKFSLYGFGDFSATEKRPFAVKSLYSEVRLSKALGRNFSLATQFDSKIRLKSNENDQLPSQPSSEPAAPKNTLRLGVSYTLGFGDFTEFRVLPVDTGKHGPQFTAVTQHKLGKWRVSAFVDYSTKGDDSILGELELGRTVGKHWTPTLQIRGSGSPSSPDAVAVILGKYTP